jgi:hypothetical protein
MGDRRDRRAYFRAYHRRNALRRNGQTRVRGYFRTQLLRWYKQTHPCVDCGEPDPLVLQFDHVTGEKLFTIGYNKATDLAPLWDEIQKCEVRCANCHIKQTWGRASAGTSDRPIREGQHLSASTNCDY